jgi:hypothetical protein
MKVFLRKTQPQLKKTGRSLASVPGVASIGEEKANINFHRGTSFEFE